MPVKHLSKMKKVGFWNIFKKRQGPKTENVYGEILKKGKNFKNKFLEKPIREIKKRIIKQKVKISSRDIGKALKITDKLLGGLPQEKIEEFARSKDFKLYKKVLTKFVPETEHEIQIKNLKAGPRQKIKAQEKKR